MVLRRDNPSSSRLKKSSPTVPSSKLNPKQLLNIKLINLYGRYECLWDIDHKNFLVGAAKMRIWSDIAHKLDPHGGISTGFCRLRMQELRQYYNYLNLQKLRTFKRRPSSQFTPLCLGHCPPAERPLYLSLANEGRDVAMSGCKYDAKHSEELLPMDWWEFAFSFLDKNSKKHANEDVDRNIRYKGE